MIEVVSGYAYRPYGPVIFAAAPFAMFNAEWTYEPFALINAEVR